MTPRTNSRSDAQKTAERAALDALRAQLGLNLVSTRLRLGGRIFDLDGYAEADDRIVLVEIWAHIGKAKSAQRHKVMTDLLKLALLTRLLRKERHSCLVEPYLVFLDADAAQVVLNQSWGALAASEFGVQPLVVAIAPALIDSVRVAQRRQDLLADLVQMSSSASLTAPLDTDE